MRRLMLIFALVLYTSVMFTSCREKSGVEKAADDIEDAAEDVTD